MTTSTKQQARHRRTRFLLTRHLQRQTALLCKLWFVRIRFSRRCFQLLTPRTKSKTSRSLWPARLNQANRASCQVSPSFNHLSKKRKMASRNLSLLRKLWVAKLDRQSSPNHLQLSILCPSSTFHKENLFSRQTWRSLLMRLIRFSVSLLENSLGLKKWSQSQLNCSRYPRFLVRCSLRAWSSWEVARWQKLAMTLNWHAKFCIGFGRS